MSHLARDRALALATLQPRNPRATYGGLTNSGRAEVDRLVAAFRQVRLEALADLAAGQEAPRG